MLFCNPPRPIPGLAFGLTSVHTDPPNNEICVSSVPDAACQADGAAPSRARRRHSGASAPRRRHQNGVWGGTRVALACKACWERRNQSWGPGGSAGAFDVEEWQSGGDQVIAAPRRRKECVTSVHGATARTLRLLGSSRCPVHGAPSAAPNSCALAPYRLPKRGGASSGAARTQAGCRQWMGDRKSARRLRGDQQCREISRWKSAPYRAITATLTLPPSLRPRWAVSA